MNTPLYRVVMDHLVDRIASGAMPPGAMLPSETQLGADLGVAQGTARKALMELETRGLVTRVQGRGTFVTQRTTEDSLFRFFRLRQHDGTMDAPELLNETVRERAATRSERATLHGEPARIFEISRLRALGHADKIVEKTIVSTARFPGLNDRAPLPNTLYVFFQQAYSCMILRADEALQATQPSADIAALLQITDTTPVLQVSRVAYDLLDQVVELRTLTCRTDRHHYTVSLT